ncbi:MAG: DUF3298 domain-containing protein [Prevotella sp.]|nr:DUF3298 domain-containing protein [Prevotella sp.]
MKKTFITLMGLLVMISCDQRPRSVDSSSIDPSYSNESAEGADNGNDYVDADAARDTVTTTPLVYDYDEDKVQVSLHLFYPESGANQYLLTAVREFISEQLGGSYTGRLDNGEALLQHYGDSIRNYLVAEHENDKANMDEDYINGYFRNIVIMKAYETERLVTFTYDEDIYLNGAHGSHATYGMTFRKSDGRRFGRDMLRCVFSEDMHLLVKDGLKRYFSDMNQLSDLTDEELKEFILTDDHVDYLPMPNHEPYITAEGVNFIYQPYEISFFAAGLPSFTVPLDSMQPFFTITAQRMAAY